jgi:hypothetical protein
MKRVVTADSQEKMQRESGGWRVEGKKINGYDT